MAPHNGTTSQNYKPTLQANTECVLSLALDDLTYTTPVLPTPNWFVSSTLRLSYLLAVVTLSAKTEFPLLQVGDNYPGKSCIPVNRMDAGENPDKLDIRPLPEVGEKLPTFRMKQP